MPKITVENAPPMNPSQVFLGDSLMRGVFPKKKPNIQAMMSLQIIIETGTINLKNQYNHLSHFLEMYKHLSEGQTLISTQKSLQLFV